MTYIDPNEVELKEKIVAINRNAKVVKGGRRFSFSAMVAVGNGHGVLGVGNGKAREVPEAIRKAGDQAKRHLMRVPIVEGTIPHEIIGKFGAGSVFMKPAGAGTGVIAGGAVRVLLEAAGIQNVLTKCIGTSNPHNAVHATLDGLRRLKTKEEIIRFRGKSS
ncbi:MAG: 30S ribosomal protein S5 [Deltaproteobacteria bacterium RIFCSPHIGHO2_12_FULL_43_9]|nr:MAG: 30S ribosomal protein S5 [Deltaproteobacteria bacterium RIFCSPHIGHO2_12_FULL_43_9]